MLFRSDPSQKQPRGNCQWSGVTIPGVPGTWNVWTDGVCISYVATSTVNSLTFDLNAFIKDATSTHTGTISSSMYLHDIFGGFEIWSGGQGLQITDFYAVVK